MDTEKKSPAYILMEYVWRNERTKSFKMLNDIMSQTLEIAIKSGMEFYPDDFKMFSKKMSSGYWIGTSYNGKTQGERFYEKAIRYSNSSAYKSFEKWINRTPFLHDHYRAFEGSYYKDHEYRYRVTGFDRNGKIYLVSYDLNDIEEKGNKKLYNFDNKEWLIFRKTVNDLLS